MIRRQCIALILALALLPRGLGSAELPSLSDVELIEAVDATTMLGKMARGTWEWSRSSQEGGIF